MTFIHQRLVVPTSASFHCHDITADLQGLVDQHRVQEGLLVAVGQHTTTALVINENEERNRSAGPPNPGMIRTEGIAP